MSFINVFIQSPCSISVKNDCLLLKNAEKEEDFPIKDIDCVMIDCLTDKISVYALNRLAESGATVIICDDKHTPSCVLTPFNGYYKRSVSITAQTETSKPRLKTLWQQIIKRKILNQADCLKYNGKDGYITLTEIAKKVKSGDTDNAEARASAVYFKKLFGTDFARRTKTLENGFLNYAYSIARSLIARHLCAHGLECSLGIFHKNTLNPFNLADDIIEPFRPIVDNFVFNLLRQTGEISPETKRQLFAIVNLNVLSGKEVHSFSNAVQRISESLLSFFYGKTDTLVFPQIYDLSTHEYE